MTPLTNNVKHAALITNHTDILPGRITLTDHANFSFNYNYINTSLDYTVILFNYIVFTINYGIFTIDYVVELFDYSY